MDKDTGFTVLTVRHTGRGSEYFGACEVCKKHMSEASFFQTYRIFKHSQNFYYLSAPSAGVYSHIDCLPHNRSAVSKSTLPKRGNLFEYPDYALKRDLMAVGLSEHSSMESMP